MQEIITCTSRVNGPDNVLKGNTNSKNLRITYSEHRLFLRQLQWQATVHLLLHQDKIQTKTFLYPTHTKQKNEFII